MEVKMDVKTDIAKAMAKIAKIEPRQFPFIVSLAMNTTMREVKKELRKDMAETFDRPTPFTLNGLRTLTATKQKLGAEVALREFAGKGTPTAKYLEPQVYGGNRVAKRFERALRASGALPADLFAVPANNAPLNKYGNVTGPYIVRMLSYLKSNTDATQNQTKKSAAKATKAFFVINTPTSRLPMGIYERKNNGIRMIFAFVKQPHYQKLFKFFEVAEEKARQHLPEQTRLAIERALSTSRTNLTTADFSDVFR